MRDAIRCLLGLTAFFLAFGLKAQPQLTASVHQPVIGDIELRYQYLDTVPINPGPAGQNVTWDFSQLQFNAAPDTVWYDSMYALGNLQANLAARRKVVVFGFTLNVHTAFLHEADKTSYVGWTILPYGPDFPFTHLTDAAITHTFPMAYSDSIYDPYNGYFTSIGIFPVNGDQISVIDGVGTLILPGGTYTDVLRLHIYNPTGLWDGETWQGYFYYSPTHRFPLFAISQIPAMPTSPFPEYIYRSEGLNVIIGQEEADRGPVVRIGPNPTEGLISVGVEGLFGDRMEWRILDQNGKVIANGQEEEVYGPFRTLLDLSNQPTGIYWLELRSGAFRTTRKIAKM